MMRNVFCLYVSSSVQASGLLLHGTNIFWIFCATVEKFCKYRTTCLIHLKWLDMHKLKKPPVHLVFFLLRDCPCVTCIQNQPAIKKACTVKHPKVNHFRNFSKAHTHTHTHTHTHLPPSPPYTRTKKKQNWKVYGQQKWWISTMTL